MVEEEGLFLPPHPGEESAMIGGVIATNAGGARAVKHGVFRNYIRGLEVVLPSGRIIHPGGKLMKTSIPTWQSPPARFQEDPVLLQAMAALWP